MVKMKCVQIMVNIMIYRLMTKYIAIILNKLGINYQKYDIQDHWDEESGETWITLHPKTDWKDAPEGLDKIRKLSQKTFGQYKIYWDENSCYVNVIGILEINSKGIQVFPLPTMDRPALFSQTDILRLWRETKCRALALHNEE